MVRSAQPREPPAARERREEAGVEEGVGDRGLGVRSEQLEARKAHPQRAAGLEALQPRMEPRGLGRLVRRPCPV